MRWLAKHKNRVVAVVFVAMILTVAFQCCLHPKLFYWDFLRHVAMKDDDYHGDFFAAARGGLENAIFNRTPCNDAWIDIYGGMQRLLGKNYICGATHGDSIKRLENGYLVFDCPKIETATLALRVVRLNEDLRQLGVPLLFVQTPGKVCKFQPRLPIGMDDWTNDISDAFLDHLNQGGVVTLDLRDVFPHDGKTFDSLFFRQDHHWNYLGGLLAAKETARFLQSRLKLNMDGRYADEGSFRREEHCFRFIASQQDRVGRLYTTRDTNTLLTPVYPTRYTVFSLEDEKLAEGSFEAIWVNRSSLADGKLIYRLYERKFDRPIRYVNEEADTDVRILFLGDSFTWAVAPFLSLFSNELIYGQGHDPTALMETVKRHKPDVVLMMFRPELHPRMLQIDYGCESQTP